MEKFENQKSNKEIPVNQTIELVCGDNCEIDLSDVKEKLAGLPLNSSLRNTIMVMLEMKKGGSALQDFVGIEEAKKLLVQNPDKKILMFSCLPQDFFTERFTDFRVLLAKDNVRFIDLHNISNIEKMNSVFDGGENEDINETDASIVEMSNQDMIRFFGSMEHSLMGDRIKSPYNRKLVEGQVKERFPSMKDLSQEEVINFVLKTHEELKFQRPEVMKGEKIEGVFCDIEGTLLIDGEVNQDTLKKLKDYESQGKQITLWTDGDVEELGKKLKELGVEYPLKSKFDHAGALAEIVIDDIDENTFRLKTKIFAKTFIKV